MAERDPAAVQAMFDSIAARYDVVNGLISFGSDARWRRRAARATGLLAGGRALDIACGSGKLSLALARLAGRQGQVVGLDFSARMLAVAVNAASGPGYVRGDALSLPFAAGTFEAVTIAFGLRNLADPSQGLREMLRVLAPGGRAAVLEFVKPAGGPVGRAYRLYLRHILPAMGGIVSGQREAYRYLSATVDSYRTPEELRELAERAGWTGVDLRLLTLGTVGLLTGHRQGPDQEP